VSLAVRAGGAVAVKESLKLNSLQHVFFSPA
jgi:hypothetical protein